MPTFSTSTYLKMGVSAVALAMLGFAYYQYQTLKNDLSDTRAQLVQIQGDYVKAVNAALQNASQAAKADADRKRIVSELEAVQTELESAQQRTNEFYFDLSNSSESDDGPVAPVLTRLQKALAGLK